MKRSIGIVLFVIGLLILVYPYIIRAINSTETKVIEQQFQEKVFEETDLSKLQQIKKCNNQLAATTRKYVDPFQELNNRFQNELCTKEIYNRDEVVGIVSIPKIKLVEPIYEGSTENELGKGVGLLEGSSIPIGGKGNHTVLAGHRGMVSKEMFLHLDKIIIGDSIFVESVNGKLEYVVYEIRVVLPDETEFLKIQEGEDLLSLFTCTPFPTGTHRLMIHAMRFE